MLPNNYAVGLITFNFLKIVEREMPGFFEADGRLPIPIANTVNAECRAETGQHFASHAKSIAPLKPPSP